jgi:uncharacterized membrane protein YkoI
MAMRRFLIALTALVAIPVLVGVAARLAVAERSAVAKATPVVAKAAPVPVAEEPHTFAQSSPYDDDGSDDRLGDDGDSDDPALDDGRGHLKNSNLTFEEARAIAEKAAPGVQIEEIDLEHVNGKLVFEVDAGSKNIMIDAKTGEVSVGDRPFSDND